MAFTNVQKTGATGDTTSISKAFASNVTANNIITVVGHRFTTSSDDFVAGDCTQSAGTATLGTITLDKTFSHNTSGSNFLVVGVWSAVVSGTGSCTMQVGNGGAGSSHNIGIAEASSSGSTYSVEATNTGEGTSGNAATGNATSAGAALFVGGVTISGSGAITITEDSPFVLMWEEENGALHLQSSAIYEIVTTGTTDAAGWTIGTNTGWSAAVVVYKEGSGAGSDFNNLQNATPFFIFQ